jgi:hypothetical protein
MTRGQQEALRPGRARLVGINVAAAGSAPRLVAGLLATAVLAGCSYAEARWRDLGDIFRVEGHLGPCLQADLKATELLHLGFGSSQGGRSGFNYGIWETQTVLEHHLPWSLIQSITEPDLEALHTISWGLEAPQHRCYILLPGVMNDSSLGVDGLHFFDLELGLYVLFPGARVGFSPGELLDFVLGFWTFDLAGDDDPEDRAAKRLMRPIERARGPTDNGPLPEFRP